MENRETNMHTEGGDKGLTSLTPGSQVSKADERVAAVGAAEEVVSALGLAKVATACPAFREKIERIQKTLRTLCAGLADPRSGRYTFSAEEVEFLESDMDGMRGKMPEQAGPAPLPGGCEQSARLDFARCAARRAERDLIAMDRRYAVPAVFKSYLNRLGSYLSVAARYADFLNAQPKDGTACRMSPEERPDAGQGGVSVASIVSRVMSDLGVRTLNAEKAERLIAAVRERAASEGRSVVIAVANAEGNPVAVHVMDGAYLVSYEAAVRKAYTAAAVRMSTRELSALVRPGGTFYGLQQLDRVMTFGGGVPLMSGGALAGGLGVSGGTGEEDDALAQYGASVFRTL